MTRDTRSVLHHLLPFFPVSKCLLPCHSREAKPPGPLQRVFAHVAQVAPDTDPHFSIIRMHRLSPATLPVDLRTSIVFIPEDAAGTGAEILRHNCPCSRRQGAGHVPP